MSDHPQPSPDPYATTPPAANAGSTGTFIPDEEAGSMIGRYKLLQRVGKGGMGEVWMAQQREPVQRNVAIKIIKSGLSGDQVVARFEAERQALAMMDHPNIAKVLDAGATAAGRPYFVMELVKGVPFNQFCDHEKLTLKDRLELFIPVCNAVQHAHQKGVVHRDLKPTNVLIALYDGKPVPKVIDFGVAKATTQKLTERTMFTEVGQIVGTLEYMAPEQAELNNLDVDTRADIYSLGVMLYELLTGATPFSAKQLRGEAFIEMLRLIKEVEPPKPSTKLSNSEELPAVAAKRKLEPKSLARLVKGELDWIVMKCLEKERSRRYETAKQVAEELGRFLRNEPVQAGPPSTAYRARKFFRRNRAATIWAALVLLALAAGIVGTLAFLHKASEDLRQDPPRVEDRAPISAKEIPFLDAKLKQQIIDLGPDAPGTLETMRRLAEAYLDAKAPEKALPLFKTFIDSKRKHVGPAMQVWKLGDALEEIARDLVRHEQHMAAESMLRECIGIREVPEAELWTTFYTKSLLGASLLGQKRFADAEPLLKAGYEGMKQREKTIPPAAKPRLAEALERLVQLYEATGNAVEAERWRKELAARKAAEKEPKN